MSTQQDIRFFVIFALFVFSPITDAEIVDDDNEELRELLATTTDNISAFDYLYDAVYKTPERNHRNPLNPGTNQKQERVKKARRKASKHKHNRKGILPRNLIYDFDNLVIPIR